MQSWDFFDTLLGRACGEPWRVFELMGGADFKSMRQLAEQKSDKTFEGIYASLKQMTGWSAEKINALREEEFALEKKLAFPIRENVARVKAGDYVITDTYFNADQIRELADVIKLPKVSIVATYGGKHGGTVWRDFAARRVRFMHTGDNRRADYDQARKYGFHAVYFRNAATGLEKTLTAAGHWDIAGLSRCARLQNPYGAALSSLKTAWGKQAQYNVPFLFLTAAKLRDYATQHRHKKLWFLSRDTCLLARVFKALYPEIPAETFYASRQTYLQPSAQFIEYARSVAQVPGALFVDLQGTGKSVAHFIAKTGINLPYLYIAGPQNIESIFPRLYNNKDIGTALEVFNYDTCGRVIDVRNGAPIRAPVEYDVELVEAAHGAVACALSSVFCPPQVPTDEIMQVVLGQVRLAAHRKLMGQHQIQHPVLLPPKSNELS